MTKTSIENIVCFCYKKRFTEAGIPTKTERLENDLETTADAPTTE